MTIEMGKIKTSDAITHNEYSYTGIKTNSECSCTHIWLIAVGFKKADINGHAKKCPLNFISIIPSTQEKGDK